MSCVSSEQIACAAHCKNLIIYDAVHIQTLASNAIFLFRLQSFSLFLPLSLSLSSITFFCLFSFQFRRILLQAERNKKADRHVGNRSERNFIGMRTKTVADIDRLNLTSIEKCRVRRNFGIDIGNKCTFTKTLPMQCNWHLPIGAHFVIGVRVRCRSSKLILYVLRIAIAWRYIALFKSYQFVYDFIGGLSISHYSPCTMRLSVASAPVGGHFEKYFFSLSCQLPSAFRGI